MAKTSDNPKPEQTDIGPLSTCVPPGPVECLGTTYPSDTERRKYFLEKLAEKLNDPEFRKIEGFPIGEDEDILALSDPPYFTACPNPWLADFVKHYGTPYNPNKPYHREPFAVDVSEGKNHPIYNAHSYHTKVPHRAIMRYILHYTDPGDVIFDGFAGTGMTGVAAHLCGKREEVQALGYQVQHDGTILNEQGQPFSKLGARKAILNDLSPAATFIARNFNSTVEAKVFNTEANRILREVEKEFGWMYQTKHTTGMGTGIINFTIWSDVLVCPECGGEVVFWDAAVNKSEGRVEDEFDCTHCSVALKKRMCDHAWVNIFDQALKQPIRQAKQVPIVINYTFGGKRYEKYPDEADTERIAQAQSLMGKLWFPTNRMMDGGETRRNDKDGITHVHHFYSTRNLLVLAAFHERIFQRLDKCPTLGLWFTSSHVWTTRQNRVLVSNYFKKKGGVIGQTLQGTLYISSLGIETNAIERFGLRIASVPFTASGRSAFISTASADALRLPAESVDYVFVDPPFGANIAYSELNFLWEAWLRVFTNIRPEAIENKPHSKTLDSYRNRMRLCFEEHYRALKPGRWITVEFSNTQAAVWNSIQTSLEEVGFVVANVSILEKEHKGFRAVTTPTAVKQDLVISAYKPNGGLENRFASNAKTDTGVWEFIRSHLGNLPVMKPRGAQLEPIVERDPRILYDRTVAFYIRHGIPVPISSPEFQAGLAEKFPERDGMYFLSDQAAEYDKVRMKMEGIGQLTLFVEDERSAVAWLRNYLKNKPCKYQDIQPEFFEQLNQSWKKWETRPELRALLDQYFLCYTGEGDVPPQIHSHLSTNFKELRNLPADHAMLRAKARDRWFVPDPRKNADVEQLREKRLLEEFWSYMPPGYEAAARRKRMQAGTQLSMAQKAPKVVKGKRIAIVRTEAVRVGFNFCFSHNDNKTIIAVARHIPEAVIQNDEQLQMIYDSAVTREGSEIE